MSDELNTFNISDSTWDNTLEIIRNYIIGKIKSKSPYKFVSYSELCEVVNNSRLGLELEEGGFDPKLWALVGALSRNEDKEGRGMMSALVVHRNGDKQPGHGFYEWAKKIGKHFDDELEFWCKEVRKVCRAYGVESV